MTSVTLPRLLAAAAIGAVSYKVAAIAWVYLSAYSPVNEVLLESLGRRGHHATYRVIISIHDVLVSVVMAAPFAAILRFVPKLRSWIYVALAAAASVIVGYASINVAALPLLLGLWAFWFGVALAALSLPAAFALLNQMRSGSIP